ncbi:MAG TPA: multicopper oxidase domain-containing protein, partial [Nitrosomonas sp.]|nr:multicopper oxidase domain-containing protein [Nitrosomonas sp.]
MSTSIYGKRMRKISITFILMALWLLSSVAWAATHTISISAVQLPNGQYGYKLNNHTSSDGAVPNYPAEAVIPGPTLFVKQGDQVTVQLRNETNIKIGFNVPGLTNGNVAPANPGQTKSYTLNTQQTGTYPYFDEKSQLLGLFGAIVVDDASGQVQSFVDGDGKITAVNRSQLDKEFVMFMVGSTFWGAEISRDGTQKPLWTN